MGKIILFTRVSTEQQHLESQEDSLRRAALLDGYSESDIVVIGNKESAIKLDEEERKGLQELKIELATGDVDIVYIFELSRLSRKPKILYSIRDQFLEAKVQLKCLNPCFMLLTPDCSQFDSTASLVFSLFGAMAEQEMIEKKARFHRGRKRLAEEGKFNGGKIPFGYRVDREHGKLIVIDEVESSMVKEVFNLYENGISQPKLAKEFYRRGNKKMTISLINNILNNERYTGRKHVYPGSSFERVYPAIITPELFDRCRIIAKENNTRADKTKNIYYAYKLIRCQYCNCLFSSSGSKVNYHCYDAYNRMRIYDYYKTPQCTSRITISINVMDSLLWYVCKQEEVNYIVNTANADIDKYKERIKILEEKLDFIAERMNDLGKKKERIVDMYIDGLLTNDKRSAKIQKIDNDRKDIFLEQVRYLNEKEHLEEMTIDLTEKYDLNDIGNIAGQIEKIMELQTRIYSITDDKERSLIIHKHVKSVTVANRELVWQFPHKLRKGIARFITIELYRGEIFYFYYLPNSGYGGLIIKADKEGNTIEPINYEYLDRFYDKSKRERHEKEKQKRKSKKESAYPSERFCYSYSGLAKFMGVTISTAFRYVETVGILKDASVGMYQKEHVFDKKKE